jgi:hypothetical protein
VVVNKKKQMRSDGVGYDTLTFSADSQRLAYTVQIGEKFCVVVDGKQGKLYDGIITSRGGKLIFDSEANLRYLAVEGNKIYKVEESTIKE